MIASLQKALSIHIHEKAVFVLPCAALRVLHLVPLVLVLSFWGSRGRFGAGELALHKQYFLF